MRPDSELLLDVSAEDASRLEATRERFGDEWRRYGLRKLRTAGIMTAVLAVAFVGLVMVARLSPPDNFVERHMSEIALFALLVAGGVALFAVWSGVQTLVSKPPLAGASPQETLELYAAGMVTYLLKLTGKFATPPWLSSYICLLDQAKAAFPDFGAYAKHEEKTGKELKEALDRLYSPSKITDMTCELGRVRQISHDGDVARLAFSLEVEATEGINSPRVSQPRPIGSATITGEARLAQVGGRWYLGSHDLNWAVVDRVP